MDWFSALSSWLLSNVLRGTQWWLGFDTSPLREARRFVWGHHIMVGEGARPLKQDYCIASDSHFNEGKLSQRVPAVCVSWSHPMHSLACHVCLYSGWSQRLESVGLHAHTQTEVILSNVTWFKTGRLSLYPSLHELFDSQVYIQMFRNIWANSSSTYPFIHPSIYISCRPFSFEMHCFASGLLSNLCGTFTKWKH